MHLWWGLMFRNPAVCVRGVARLILLVHNRQWYGSMHKCKALTNIVARVMSVLWEHALCSIPNYTCFAPHQLWRQLLYQISGTASALTCQCVPWLLFISWSRPIIALNCACRRLSQTLFTSGSESLGREQILTLSLSSSRIALVTVTSLLDKHIRESFSILLGRLIHARCLNSGGRDGWRYFGTNLLTCIHLVNVCALITCSQAYIGQCLCFNNLLTRIHLVNVCALVNYLWPWPSQCCVRITLCIIVSCIGTLKVYDSMRLGRMNACTIIHVRVSASVSIIFVYSTYRAHLHLAWGCCVWVRPAGLWLISSLFRVQ